MKSGRQGTILRIISEQSIETQNQLMDELKKRGIDTTQATLSRDIRELRLVKQRSADGTSRYAAAEVAPAPERSQGLKENLRQTGTGVYACQNLVIIKTLPGLADAAGAAIDAMKLPDMLGCISGNDAVAIVARGEQEAERLCYDLRQYCK